MADLSKRLQVKEMPVVVNLSYSVHGNEPSGRNAGVLVAYYLAASMGEEVASILREAVILLDPSLNPDGMERYAQWVNRHRGKTLNPDPNDREHRESWPSARTNYYLFDLNRDWLPAQHPESRGRLEQFHRWKLNVLADFHEMSADATFRLADSLPNPKPLKLLRMP